MHLEPAYPTEGHAHAGERVVEFFSSRPEVDAVLMVGSCARGRGAQDIDFAMLVQPDVPQRDKAALESDWARLYESEAVFASVRRIGPFARVDVDFFDGRFAPEGRSWTSGPEAFELEIGNYVAYSVPLWERNDRFQTLRERWLPYYGEDLRRERLADVLKYCRNNLDHVPWFASRGLPFQAFHRLYDAYREFLQGLFIARRRYPIAYDKWIREQVVEILGLPELYPVLVDLLQIRRLEGDEIVTKAETLRALVEEVVVR